MKKGFSLVELSVMLVVLGLLIGGVIVGASLVGSAKLQKLVIDLQKYEALTKKFKDKYHYWPGDMPNASSFWTGAFDGDGDGRVNLKATVRDETLAAFSHLSLSDVIINEIANGEYLESNDYNAQFALHSGSARTYDMPANGTGVGDNLGLYFMNKSGWHTGVLSPKDAFYVDKKIDDATPDKGRLVATDDYPSGSSNTCINGEAFASPYSGTYNMDEGDEKCVLIFYLESESP